MYDGSFYPTVLGESKFGNLYEALAHLHEKVIATHLEEIPGGGLLKSKLQNYLYTRVTALGIHINELGVEAETSPCHCSSHC